MTEPDQPKHDGRLDTILPGVSVGAKVALLAGLAGGLFAAIVVSYVDNTRQYQALAAGILLGVVGAIGLTLRSRSRNRGG
jgi:ABC-type Mn2+/Zn2+ transport system permease subunit